MVTVIRMVCCGQLVDLLDDAEPATPPDDRSHETLAVCPVCGAQVVIEIRGGRVLVVPVRRQ